MGIRGQALLRPRWAGCSARTAMVVSESDCFSMTGLEEIRGWD